MDNSFNLEREQKVCLKCGICCDGTLFIRASLEPGEKKGLPKKFESKYFTDVDGDFLKQPCFFFKEKCSIYDQVKPHICGAFRCQLLKNFEVGKITQNDAFQLVDQTKQTREEILSEYSRLSSESRKMTFMDILVALGEKQKELDKQGITSMEWELFAVKCNIFNSLLIKHFKSEENFRSMIAKEE